MGCTDCLKESSHTKPRLRIICTWLNSLPGAGSGRNCFPSFAEWKIVPFSASSVSFYLGNSLTLPELNTALLFPCVVSLHETGGNPTLKLLHFSVFISMDLMDLLCLARWPAVAKRGTWWPRRDPSGTQFLWVLMGGLQWCPWLVPPLSKLNDAKGQAQTFSTSNCQGLPSAGNLNQVIEF